jgi:hypothetical protein
MTLFTKKFLKVPNIKFLSMFREIGRNAFVDWLIILIVNVSVALVLMMGGLYLYWQVSTGNVTVYHSPAKVNKKIFDIKDLERVINLYQAKVDNSDQAKMGYRGPSDPSL